MVGLNLEEGATIVVAIFAAVIAAAAAFGLAFLVDFLEELLLIRDFFVTAMVLIPQNLI